MDERHSAILRYGREHEFAGMNWSLAACAGVGAGLFYVGSDDTAAVREAKAVCAGCVIRSECLEYALVGMEKYGVWGGLSERERRRIRSTRYNEDRGAA